MTSTTIEGEQRSNDLTYVYSKWTPICCFQSPRFEGSEHRHCNRLSFHFWFVVHRSWSFVHVPFDPKGRREMKMENEYGK